ncbi:TPA: hypothetical protein L3769_004942 [Pseudomonas aeruginosa]|nr:hypothetical protein [Pseudomonas aeruginosa]HBN8081818.1 hypothetical protein [Pseudomonas aeruginosa]HBN8178508.1 hypothetical protein [Pseudomonas aeruginosa]HBN8816546.1 hypothetical protein [Pseudomonas aeruginosa]
MDEPLFNELLESVKQADQIMSDHAELRRLAKRADALHGTPSLEHIFAITKFREAVEPKAILALLDEIDGMKASGWRNHSVNYARAEKCPQTLETAQAAWDRDQELIEEQRQQISRDSQTINQLRQKLQSAEVDRDRLKAENERLLDELSACTEHPGGCGYWREAAKRRAEDRDRLKAENDALRGALQAVVDDPTWRSNDNTLWPKIIKAMDKGATQ